MAGCSGVRSLECLDLLDELGKNQVDSDHALGRAVFEVLLGKEERLYTWLIVGNGAFVH